VSESVHFASCGVRCAADLYVPDAERFSFPRPGVVIGHGFGVVKEALPSHAAYLVEAGYVVLAIDYRTFGSSDGEPRRQLFPLNQVEDFRNAISWLEQRTDLVDADKIGIWGVSFGGGIVLYTAAVEQRVKVVVAQSPALGRRWTRSLHNPFEWEEMQRLLLEDRRKRHATGQGDYIPLTAMHGTGTPSAMPGDDLAVGFCEAAEAQLPTYKASVTLESVEKVIEFFPDRVTDLIAPRPLLIVTNGSYDLHHPLEQVRVAYDRAGEPKKLVVLPYDTVGLYQEPGLGVAMRHAVAWFDRHLAADQRAEAEAEAEALADAPQHS
jgi:dienelactone hydrolase